MKYDNIIIEKIKKKYHYTDNFLYSLPEKELNFIVDSFKNETIYERNDEIINNIVILFDDYNASYIWKYRTEYEQSYKYDNRYILLKYISSCKVKYFYDRYKNNGKVIMLSGRESAKCERRKLRKLKTKYLKNEISKTEILNLFLSWSGNILKSFNAYNLYKQNYIYFKKLIF